MDRKVWERKRERGQAAKDHEAGIEPAVTAIRSLCLKGTLHPFAFIFVSLETKSYF